MKGSAQLKDFPKTQDGEVNLFSCPSGYPDTVQLTLNQVCARFPDETIRSS